MKFRQNLYIDSRLNEALEALAASPGATKSGILSDALAAYIARRGTKEVDDLLKVRLDRMSRDMHRIARDTEAFVAQVGRQIAGGKRSIGAAKDEGPRA